MTQSLVNLANPEKLFIAGEWANSSASDRIDIISPASEERVGQVAKATREDMDRAVAAIGRG